MANVDGVHQRSEAFLALELRWLLLQRTSAVKFIALACFLYGQSLELRPSNISNFVVSKS
jgi:hypothetical protein